MKHAHLHPSGAARWMVCPGSVRSSAGLPDESEYADQGQACHSLLARRLRGESWEELDAVAEVVVADEESGRSVRVEVQDDMRHWVKTAAAWVELYVATNPRTLLRVEARSPVGDYFGVPDDIWGHSDIVLSTDRKLVVVDAKFGRVEVEVEENQQLGLYALGFAEQYAWAHQEYELVILQPRSPKPVKTEKLTREQLMDRGRRYAPKIEAALKANAPLVPSDHCHGCPAAGVCRALQDRAAELAARAFQDPDHLDAAGLARVLDGIKVARKAFDAAESAALRLLGLGQELPGWKRVHGQGRRAWSDAKEAERQVKALGLDPWKHTLLSPNQVEETLGGGFKLPASLAPKSPGQPTLAPAEDKRPALPPDFQPETPAVKKEK